MSIILISAPAFSYVTNSSHCDNDVLSTYSGSANLTANWQGNPITVTWYNDDTQYASNSCTYGGNLTMPSSIPQKTGYTFKGWRARSGGMCGLTGDMVSACNPNNQYTNSWAKGINNGNPWCFLHGGHVDDCSANATLVELNTMEWKIEYNYGSYKGTAVCSNKPIPDINGIANSLYQQYESLTNQLETDYNNGMITEDEFYGQACMLTVQMYKEILNTPGVLINSETINSYGSGGYCWCHMESYTPNGGTPCSLSASSWFAGSDYYEDCSAACVNNCTGMFNGVMPGLKEVLFRLN